MSENPGDAAGAAMRGVNIYWKKFGEPGAPDHRQAVGGMWDELGELQFRYLVDAGLKPDHKLLDVGCGSLRGGIRFVEYLEPGNYYGLDVNESLLDAGRQELEARGLGDRGANLLADDAFRFERFGVPFDHAVAVSVFTHLPANHVSRCFGEMAKVLKPGASFHFTYFEAPRARWLEPIVHEPGGITSHADRDPFHYSREELRALADAQCLGVEFVGDWAHPRDQRMARARTAPHPRSEMDDFSR
jgi:SAM-dependent methyltransferase